MSTLIEDIETLLKTVAPAGGVWYGVNTTEPPVYPYIAWIRVVSTDNVSLRGPSDLQNTMIQIEAVARKISDADTLMNAIDTAFQNGSITNVPISSLDLFEDAIRAFRVIRDYSIWAKN